MARGESPFQGRYTVPIADFSGIERAGAAWGDAFKDVGKSIGGAIEKYQLNKKKRTVLEDSLQGKIEALMEHDPKGAEALFRDESFDKDTQRLATGEMKLSELEGLVGKIDGYSGQTQNIMRDKLAASQAQLAAGTLQSNIEIAGHQAHNLKIGNAINQLNLNAKPKQLKHQLQQLKDLVKVGAVRAEVAESTKDAQIEVAEAGAAEAKLRQHKQEELETWRTQLRIHLAGALLDREDWVGSGKVSDEDWLNEQSKEVRHLIANIEPIQSGTYTPMTDEEKEKQEYSSAFLQGNLKNLDMQQRVEREELERGASASAAVSPEDAASLAKARQAAQLATAKGVPAQLETAADVAKEQLARAQYMNSAEVRDMDSAARKVALAANLSLIKARNMQTETQRQKIYASMNPSDSKLLEANDKELKAAFTRIVKWEDDDGKVHRGPYEDWLEKFSTDDDLIPSRGIIDNEDRIKGLLFQQEQIGGRNMVWADDSPAQQAQQAGADGPTPGLETFEEWKGELFDLGGKDRRRGVFGLGASSYKDYVEDMKSKGFLPFQISPPPTKTEPDWRK